MIWKVNIIQISKNGNEPQILITIFAPKSLSLSDKKRPQSLLPLKTNLVCHIQEKAYKVRKSQTNMNIYKEIMY